MLTFEEEHRWAGRHGPGARIGFDIVQVSGIAASLSRLGDAFRERLFTAQELAYAASGAGQEAERLAARFAAKEAVIKLLGLAEAGIGWRDIEVARAPDGSCSLHLHGRVADVARGLGLHAFLVSLSHDGDYAGAFVLALSQGLTND